MLRTAMSLMVFSMAAVPAHAASVFDTLSLADEALQQQRGGHMGGRTGLSLSESYVQTQFRATADLRAITFENWFFENGPTLFGTGTGAVVSAQR